jgi:hypothetical protein
MMERTVRTPVTFIDSTGFNGLSMAQEHHHSYFGYCNRRLGF